MEFSPTPVLLSVPHVVQHSAGDCLAACAAMVLRYFRNMTVSYNRLNQILAIQPDFGAPFSNICRLAQLNITVLYQQGTLADLHHSLVSGWPCVVPVDTGELPYWVQIHVSHAVVIIGMDTQFVYLNDPAFTSSPIRVPTGDFDLAWLERDEMFAVLAPNSAHPL